MLLYHESAREYNYILVIYNNDILKKDVFYFGIKFIVKLDSSLLLESITSEIKEFNKYLSKVDKYGCLTNTFACFF